MKFRLERGTLATTGFVVGLAFALISITDRVLIGTKYAYLVNFTESALMGLFFFLWRWNHQLYFTAIHYWKDTRTLRAHKIRQGLQIVMAHAEKCPDRELLKKEIRKIDAFLDDPQFTEGDIKQPKIMRVG